MDPFKEWPSWKGADGKTFAPGDTVAVATVSLHSPVMRIGKVIRINSVDSKGQELSFDRLDQGDDQAHADMLNARTQHGWSSTQAADAQEKWEKTRIPYRVDRCTVTVQVNGNTKVTTYKDPSNIVKLS